MKIVLDTNLLLSSISPKSSTHWLYQALFDGTTTLCVTTEILDEYAEIIEWGFRSRGREVANAVLEAIIHSPFTEQVIVYYRWGLMTVDYDDNKFVDCALAAGADYIVTEDGHFDALAAVPFPKLQVLSLAQFQAVLAQFAK